MNTLKEYLVRASLEFRIDFDHASREQNSAIPLRLPVNVGPFQLDRSPNAEHYLAEIGAIDPEQLGRDHPDWEYPVSFLYVESKISVRLRQLVCKQDQAATFSVIVFMTIPSSYLAPW